jgi:UDP-N-acetylmuramoyl-tripeptide--D-alanyl-D-alanine ligase
MRIRASEAAAAVGGELVGDDIVFDGADFDSRSVGSGMLFVALRAARDGHDFVGAAVTAGAVACLVERPVAGVPSIVVADTGEALADLARFARPKLRADVIGITGSVGKTSTKDFCAAALATGLRTAANVRSFNNDQGLPVTVLGAPDDTEALVLEMGMRGFGEIARLCGIGAPRIGVVTAVAEAHGERVGGIEGVARAKSELPASLPEDGVAVLNADDPRVRAMSTITPAGRVILFGESADADVRITDVRIDDTGRPRAHLVTPWGNVDIAIGAPGRHMLVNAAAAVAVAGELGIAPAAAAAAIGSAELSPHRMALVHTTSGIDLLDDCYNANPTSMRAALETLAALPARRRIAIVGLMAELDDASNQHRAIREYADELGIEVRPSGTAAYGVDPMDDDRIVADLQSGDAVLVKGSRVAGLERFVDRLVR